MTRIYSSILVFISVSLAGCLANYSVPTSSQSHFKLTKGDQYAITSSYSAKAEKGQRLSGQIISDSIDEYLKSRSLSTADRDHADLWVEYDFIAEPVGYLFTKGNAFTVAGWDKHDWNAEGFSHLRGQPMQFSLYIDIVSRQQGKVVWRGSHSFFKARPSMNSEWLWLEPLVHQLLSQAPWSQLH